MTTTLKRFSDASLYLNTKQRQWKETLIEHAHRLSNNTIRRSLCQLVYHGTLDDERDHILRSNGNWWNFNKNCGWSLIEIFFFPLLLIIFFRSIRCRCMRWKSNQCLLSDDHTVKYLSNLKCSSAKVRRILLFLRTI